MLLAPDLQDWLGAGHPARWVDDLVEHGLGLSGVYADYTDVRGGPPYDPRLMLKVLIYGCSHGITSSRALERRCQDDVAFRFLTAQAAPDFVAISRFAPGTEPRSRSCSLRRWRCAPRRGWCGWVGLGWMGRRCEPAPGDELRLDGAGRVRDCRRGDELPAELTRREGRLAAIRKAKAALEAEHAAKARAHTEQEVIEGDQDPGQVIKAGDAAEAAAVVPDRAQRSFTDPDARIMKTSDGSFHHCFNGQAVVDEKSQVVLAAQLRQSGSDAPAPPDMLTELAASLTAAGINATARTLLADAGHLCAENIAAAAAAGIDPLLATGRLKHGQKPPPVPRGRIPAGLTPKQRISRKLRTRAAKRDYARRKAIVEPGFGPIKVAQRAHQLRLRGKVKAEIEWTARPACQNFRELAGSGWTTTWMVTS
jgi:hypothetical protein